MINLKIIQILFDIIAIVLVISSIIYFVTQKEYAEAFIKDPCQVCHEKTGARCVSNTGIIYYDDLFKDNNSESNEDTP